MKLNWKSLFCLFVVIALLAPLTLRAEVNDNAAIFTKEAVDKANDDTQQMKKSHNKELVVESFKSVPDDQKAEAAANKSAFFKKWMASRAKTLKVNGVYVLICMDPKFIEVGAGTQTVKRGDFTEEDVNTLRQQLQTDMKAGDYDKALSNAVDLVERTYSGNIHEPARRGAYNAHDSEYSPGHYGTPVYPTTPMTSPSGSSGFGTFGSLICLAIGAVIVISLIRTVFRGGSSGGYGGGGYYPGNQGYAPGNFGGGYGGGGGGGSGFGTGFLGGLLGGAVGGYAADKFDHRNDQSNSGFFGGGASQGGNSGGSFDNSSSTSSFDSGPSDAGGGFGDSSSGGSFDSGSSSSDSGGGGSSGGDF